MTNATTALLEFIQQYPRLLVLTGAGISTDSGIPDYRDQQGQWKRPQPVQHPDFMGCEHTRKRYWGRSLVGWPVMRDARPNPAHSALATLERLGHVSLLVTQNVDGLHQRAGSEKVVDLHGRSDQVVCMSCSYRCSRDDTHQRSAELNPAFMHYTAATAPDGDADLEVDFSRFHVPGCDRCGGILKPDVVFFGDNVPKQRVADSLNALDAADGLLVIGSSLMVYSGFRFCRKAQEWNKPIAALTLGKTRADELLSLKLNAPITPLLQGVLNGLSKPQPVLP